MTIRINVTQEDINHGKRVSACECPVALAAARVIGRPVTVTPKRLRIYEGPYETASPAAYPLPVEAAMFVNRFDHGGARMVKPFTFDLEVQ